MQDNCSLSQNFLIVAKFILASLILHVLVMGCHHTPKVYKSIHAVDRLQFNYGFPGFHVRTTNSFSISIRCHPLLMFCQFSSRWDLTKVQKRKSSIWAIIGKRVKPEGRPGSQDSRTVREPGKELKRLHCDTKEFKINLTTKILFCFFNELLMGLKLFRSTFFNPFSHSWHAAR